MESNNILTLINKASKNKLEKLEDNIFEINSWEEVEDILS